MKGQLKSGAKFAAILLVTATLGFAQSNMYAPPTPYGGASNSVGYGQAQPQRQAVPGTVNYVEGLATLNGQPLGPNAAGYAVVQPNEAIDTQNGYVEVLLTPGAFLRIGNNSEVVMQSAGLANIQVQVVRGEAMIEIADLVKGTTMQVNMNGATAQLEERGLYGFDANQQLVRVLDGKAKVLDASLVKTVGKGDQLVLSTAKLKTAGFDKKVVQAEPLYVWSAARSQAESQANVAVARNINVYGGWYGPGWYWDPFWAEYAFLPGAGFLYSPFGWGFYSPAFIGVYGAGFYGHGFYGRPAGVAASVHASAAFRAGFASGGFHGGGGRR